MTTPRQNLRVLLVEDNSGDAALLQAFLDSSAFRFDVILTTQLRPALDELSRHQPDAVLLDLGLPDSQGLATLAETRRVAPHVPVVVLTGLNDGDVALQALQEGAQDYLVKGNIETRSLVQSLRHAIQRQKLQVEAEHLQHQQMAWKDEFLSHVSHELRSPLNAICQFVGILKDGLAGECTPQQREFLQIISRNAQQLRSMIGELLDVTRAGAGKLTVDLQITAVAPVFHDAMQSALGWAESKGISVTSDVPPGLPPVLADPDRLRQILVNLIDNAVKFTPSGGKISLTVALSPSPTPQLKFSVSDTGCGIAPDQCEIIFQRLYQVSRHDAARTGLGLGLYICRQLVALQNGRIWVEHSSPSGTCFSFTLPVLSFEEILAPLLTQDIRPGNLVALLGVELSSPEHWPSKAERERVSGHVHHVLSRSVLANLDVVLPKMPSSGDRDFFFAVAVVGPKGADAMAQRVRKQLARDELLQQAGVCCSVDVKMLSLEENPEVGPSEMLSRLANNIWETIIHSSH